MAGTLFYQFGAGKMDPGETIVFTAAGTKTVTRGGRRGKS
jgi:hypothetical protein